MSATRYTVQCSNGTDQAWCFALYQDFPQSAGLSSVAWKILPLPKAGAVPSTGYIPWDMQYGVAILDFDEVSGTRTGSQIVNAKLGSSYEVVTDPVVPTPTIQETSGSDPALRQTQEFLHFKNNTRHATKMGFSLSNDVIAVSECVEGGVSVHYQPHPSYYMACYYNIQQGQLITSDQALGPVAVQFPDGSTKAIVRVVSEDGQLKLQNPEYEYQ